MKKILLTLLLAAAGSSLFAQGTVTFINTSSTFTSAGDRYVYLGATGVDANRLRGTQYRAQLYYSSTAGGVYTAADTFGQPAGTYVAAAFRATTTTNPGTWVQQDKTIPGAQGTTVFLQVRVWDSTFGSTYENRTGGAFGQSDPFAWKIPLPGEPAFAQNIEGLHAFSVVPEPGTFALAGLGLLGLVMARRRK